MLHEGVVVVPPEAARQVLGAHAGVPKLQLHSTPTG